MTRTWKVLYSAMLGAWGGFLAWIVLDPLLHVTHLTNAFLFAGLNGVVVGALAGMLIGAFEKFDETSSLVPTLLGAFVGLVLGGIGGTAGTVLAQLPFQTIAPSGTAQYLFTGIGWAIFGLGVGLTAGIATFTLKKVLYSTGGGFLGGLAGGGAFILLLIFSPLTLFTRALGFTLLGACVGLLIALAIIVGTEGQLRVVRVRTRDEGRRVQIIGQRKIAIGSAPDDDLRIQYDQTVPAHHAEVRREGKKLVLHSRDSASPALVNGQPVLKHVLANDDLIRVGQTLIQFTEMRKSA